MKTSLLLLGPIIDARQRQLEAVLSVPLIVAVRYFTNNAKLMSPVARLRPKVWLVSASRVVYSLVAMSVSLGTAMPSTKPSTEAATSQ